MPSLKAIFVLRHEPPLPLVPVSVPARYLQQMGIATGNHIEKRDQSAIKKRAPAHPFLKARALRRQG